MSPEEKIRRNVAQAILDQMNRIYTDDPDVDQAFAQAHRLTVDAARKVLLEWIRQVEGRV